MNKRLFLLAILFLAIIQTTVINFFGIFGVKPNLLLLAVVIAALNFRLRWILAISICAGLLSDIFSIYKFGISTFLFPLWGVSVFYLSRKISLDNEFIKSLAVFIVLFLNNTANRLIFNFLGNFIYFGIFLRVTIIESLYTMIIAYFIFRFLSDK